MQEPKSITPDAAALDNTIGEVAATGTMHSPFCRELRSKKFYTLTVMPTEAEHLLDMSGNCWCRRTHQAFGPDGERALPEDCTSGRTCYRSLFEPR